MEEITFNGKHYEVKLPFREEHPSLPDNHTGSVKRLSSLISQLKTNPNLLQEYDNIIQDQIESGVVEPANDVLVPVGNVHYLPHREVVREDKNTTKVRVVYDASAKSEHYNPKICSTRVWTYVQSSQGRNFRGGV